MLQQRTSSFAHATLFHQVSGKSALQDGNTLVNAQTIVYTGTEGGTVTVKCSFSSSGRSKVFCKGRCNQEDILIQTTGVTAQNGRYSIQYESTVTEANVLVTITQLTESDSGRYRCGSRAQYQQIEIIVVDVLLDGNPPVRTLYPRPGGSITVACFFTVSESRKYFCKDDCKEEDILVETTGFRGQKGRYKIRYIKGFSTGGFVFVRITQLTQSDSGQYRCGLDRPSSQDPYQEFRIIVTDGSTTSKPNLTVPAVSTSVPSTFTPTTQQTTATTDMWLYVALTLGVLVVLLSLAVLVYCRNKSTKPKDPPVETECTVTETHRVYEDIREDRRSRSPPVEISPIYTNAKYTKTNGAETNNEYSCATIEDDSSNLIYSELNFSNRTVDSPSSALRGDSDNVVYSVPRVQASSDSSRPGDDPPVYSTVP
ncbi:polymeric immunoglobulin receptor-like isoform X3 [Dicentrarchus labrax]|uniref:polymeric immunoglobulin receptor-like isoform X3 n=1 Tax=Dicentrarchus labrax TaxID=13489 RepID=UPI0021F6550A|nr:polymeric immunoglobulin receptor-like isoform X3 [Dicentrarchus labrax]